MKLDKLNKFEQDPSPLNGAYIRSLVKQLTTTKNSSSKPNDTTTTGCVVVDNSTVSQSCRNNLRKHSKVLGSQFSHQQQQNKKQVRRRLHTTRPYQERLLNMAEARREIVTALKFHRANMKQASESQQQQQIQEQNQQKQDEQNTSFFEQDGKFDSWRNSRSLPPPPPSSSCMNNFPSNTNMIDEFSYSPFFSNIPLPSIQDSFQNFPVFASTTTYSSPIDTPLLPENPNFTSLPNHSLGLNSNFNFHNFNNLDATLFLNNNNNINSSLFCYSSTASPFNYFPPLSVVTDQKVPSIIGTTTTFHGEGVSSSSMVDNNNNNNNTIESMATTHDVVVGGGGGGLHMHTTMDDEGIKEIESLCEQYQMEWNDTMNFITSTWWFNFLNNIENGEPEIKT